MTSRTWLFSQLTTGLPALQTIIGTRVYEPTSLDVAPETKPFLLFRGIAHLSDFRGDDSSITKSETYLIFVHDKPGDYMQIDTVLGLLRQLLDGAVDQANNIIRVTWLEDSEDFRDEDMGTIMKYSRFMIKYRV